MPLAKKEQQNLKRELENLNKAMEKRKKEIQNLEGEIFQARINLRELITRYFSDLSRQVAGTSLETFNDFVIREIGEEGININTRVQNVFERETQGILNEIAKIETSFNADRSFFEKHAGTFGKIGNEFLKQSGHPDSINNIIHAELELLQSENDLLNDFTSIIVKYSKTLEYEIYLFAKKVLLKACAKDPNLYDLDYKVQGKSLILEDFFIQKPNLGSIKYLLRHEKIQYHLEENLNRFINYAFSKSLAIIQDIRNEAVHEKAPSLHEVEKLRNEILGIEGASLLKSILTRKEAL